LNTHAAPDPYRFSKRPLVEWVEQVDVPMRVGHRESGDGNKRVRATQFIRYQPGAHTGDSTGYIPSTTVYPD